MRRVMFNAESDIIHLDRVPNYKMIIAVEQNTPSREYCLIKQDAGFVFQDSNGTGFSGFHTKTEFSGFHKTKEAAVISAAAHGFDFFIL